MMNKGSIGSSKWLTYVTDKLFSFAPFLDNLINNSTEEVDELVSDLSGFSSYTSMVTSMQDLRFYGYRVGNTYTLAFEMTGAFNVVNNFGEARIEIMNAFNFLQGKTIKRLSGSFGTNVNSPTDGRYFIFGYTSRWNPTSIAFNFAGDDVAVSNRAIRGTLVIIID